MNKKGIIWLVVIVVIVALFFIFKGNKDTQKTSVKSEVINIGVSIPLSGFAANYGDSSKKGIALALEDIAGKYPGLNFNLSYEDSFYSTKGAVDGYQKLKSTTDMNIFIVGGSQMANATKPMTKEDGVLEMAIWTAVPSYSSDHYLNFRTTPLPAEYMSAIMSYFTGQNTKKLAILYAENEFGISFKDVLNQQTPGAGIAIVSSESFLTDAVDFRTQLAKAKAAGADTIFYVGTVAQLSTVLKQSSDLGVKAKFVSIHSVEDPQLIKNVGELAEGLVYAYPFDSSVPAAASFVEKHKQKFNNEHPNIYTAESYVAMQLIAEAVNACESQADPICMKNYLEKIGNIPTVMGEAFIDDRGDLKTSQMFLKTIKNGQFVKYEQ